MALVIDRLLGMYTAVKESKLTFENPSKKELITSVLSWQSMVRYALMQRELLEMKINISVCKASHDVMKWYHDFTSSLKATFDIISELFLWTVDINQLITVARNILGLGIAKSKLFWNPQTELSLCCDWYIYTNSHVVIICIMNKFGKYGKKHMHHIQEIS